MNFKKYFNENADIVNLYLHSKEKVKDIAQKTGKSVPEVYRTLRKYSLEPSRINSRKDVVLSYHKAGMSISEIAEKTGYSTRNVRHIIGNST